ncbi:MAG: AAA family ATPase [Rhodothermaceae bacterium]|nr:AAA family ATPase [Rhodothermaceae bacterium]
MNTYLKKISTSSGFLEDCPVEFGRTLTCIIGARGTCKSTLIESIRFAFETEKERIATIVGKKDGDNQGLPTFGIIKTTLRAGSVRCELETSGTSGSRQDYTLEREIDGEPRIFINGVREHTSRDLLHGIEIFSQGDLQRIAEENNNALRLTLIDRPHKEEVQILNENRQKIAHKLSHCGLDLRKSRDRISTLGHEVAQLSSVPGQLNQLQKEAPVASPELEAEQEAHEDRRRVLESLKSVEADREELVQRIESARALGNKITESVSDIEIDGGILPVDLTSRLEELSDGIDKVMTGIEKVISMRLALLIDALEQRFEEASEMYYQLRQQEQVVNESLKKEKALIRQLEYLEGLRTKMENKRAEESRFLRERQDLRAQLRQIDDRLYALRIAEIDSINRDHRDTVQLSLSSSWKSHKYAKRLKDLLGGSRIWSQDDVARSIAEQIEPSELIDLVETGDAQRLADLLKRDLGQMTRVIAHIGDHPKLYDLEKEKPADLLSVTFFDKGEPKAVETLSKGQRATALLPIILRPLPYPLLFDPPEGDLDNSFIFKSLIDIVRELKSKRQLIFVTHNANIPVLGDAEKIVVMRMQNPTKASPALTGDVENRKKEILNLLEGGAEAFARRERYYGNLLNRSDDEMAEM